MAALTLYRHRRSLTTIESEPPVRGGPAWPVWCRVESRLPGGNVVSKRDKEETHGQDSDDGVCGNRIRPDVRVGLGGERSATRRLYLIEYFSLLPKLSQPIVIKYYSNFSLIFMQDSGNNIS